MRNTAVTRSWVVITLLLFAPPPATAAADDDGAPKAPAEKTAPPAAANPGADPGADALRAARAFLHTVGKSEDAAAYELAAPEYREAHTAEQFAELMEGVRGTAGLWPTPPLTGWVLTKPAEGEPRRAMFASSALRFRPGPVARADAASGPVGVELVEHDGRWLVADVRQLVPGKIDGHFQFMPGREAYDYGAPLRRLAKPGGPARLVTSATRGVLTDVKAGSVTLRVEAPKSDAPDAKPAPESGVADAPAERTFSVDGDTIIALEFTSEHKFPDGRVGKATRITRGAAADLKAGAEVTVEPGDDDDHAAEVRVKGAAGGGDPGL